MSFNEILAITIVSVLTGVNAVAYIMQKYIIERYKTVLKTYEQEVERSKRLNDEVLKYCLVHIYNKAVIDEDYLAAKRCKDLLSLLEIKPGSEPDFDS